MCILYGDVEGTVSMDNVTSVLGHVDTARLTPIMLPEEQ